jgi:hypothetical protein
VAAQQAVGAEELLGQHRAHKHVRPGGPAEREHVVRPREHRGIQPLGTADGEGDGLAEVAPAREALCKGFRRLVRAAQV